MHTSELVRLRQARRSIKVEVSVHETANMALIVRFDSVHVLACIVL